MWPLAQRGQTVVVIPLLSLLLLVAVFLTSARVAAVALEATGMARDSAQFQARSALMGVGFTTAEAEDITSHPQRRRIVMWLMTFGNAGVVTGVTSLLLTFVNADRSVSLQRTAVLLGGVVLLLLALHTAVANRVIESSTRSLLRRFTELDTRDFSALMRFESDFAITELQARTGEWIVGRPLSAMHLTSEGVVVLGIHRHDGAFIGAPTGDTMIHDGDAVLAYGKASVLAELAVRQVASGDNAHELAVEEHLAIVESETDE